MKLLMSLQKKHSKHEYSSNTLHLEYVGSHFLKHYETVESISFVAIASAR